MDVILLSESGEPIGTCPKELVHTEDTALHQAFSCHVFNDQGQVLVTRRALGKRTWPGVWTNSFCGHPQPGERMESAIIRHARHELGMAIEMIEPLVPTFRYRAVDASGIVENEICPVYSARIHGELAANPEEVMDYQWVDPARLGDALSATPWAFSPWLVEQSAQMELYR
ncbi:isopentenyl-diphosphate Delta-isomerase [Glutamicibacter uratoxydans]|uniref:Isopentenyl-diphosphate Delta-isomerase n=1 Tax=Glutamicibacter uratoxydans TaxID=43667 RepID=A0A4Y4DK84_GLUUR|nr:isopentenyl-diphosphate Delta-isomerase [Glutamicibacter uratoxydans]GED05712.1 isopentenyl-diphosphate Delta-isomerase [Glutamicibacter uratoxydans]